MPEFQFKIGRELYHFGDSGLKSWSRTSSPGALYFNDVEVRQVEDMIPEWPQGRREFVIESLRKSFAKVPNPAYAQAIARVENPRRTRARKRQTGPTVEFHSFSDEWLRRNGRISVSAANG